MLLLESLREEVYFKWDVHNGDMQVINRRLHLGQNNFLSSPQEGVVQLQGLWVQISPPAVIFSFFPLLDIVIFPFCTM